MFIFVLHYPSKLSDLDVDATVGVGVPWNLLGTLDNRALAQGQAS